MDKYIAIQEFMVTDLHLSGNELIAYAMIHGFSKDGINDFHGSINYLASWCGVTERGATKILKRLEEKNLIKKNYVIISGRRYCKYMVTGEQSSCHNLNKVPMTPEQSSCRNLNKVPMTPEQSSYNNKIDNKVDNKKDIKRKEIYKEKLQKRFVKPTLEQVKQYVFENSLNVDCEYFYDYYQSNGWTVGKNHMKDWKATVRNWSRRNQKNVVTKKSDIEEWLEIGARLDEQERNK